MNVYDFQEKLLPVIFSFFDLPFQIKSKIDNHETKLPLFFLSFSFSMNVKMKMISFSLF